MHIRWFRYACELSCSKNGSLQLYIVHVYLRLADNAKLICTKGESRDLSLNKITRTEFCQQKLCVSGGVCNQ